MTRFTLLPILLACGTAQPANWEAKSELEPVYDVHEWGLLDQNMTTGEIALPSPGGPAPAAFGLGLTGVGMGKPVLYFHLESKHDLDVRTRVRLVPEMVFAEHYPPAELEDGELSWNARIMEGACEGSRTYPNADDERCQTEDGICEVSELGDYETTDASCLQVGERQWPFLFYRTSPAPEPPNEEQRVPLPIQAERDPNGTIRIRNRGGEVPMQPLWRIMRRGERIAVTRIEWPLPGEAVTIPQPELGSGDADAVRDMLSEAIGGMGLLESEARAFRVAWEDELLGPRVVAEDTTGAGEASWGTGYGRGGGMGGRPVGLGGLLRGHYVFSDVLLYWLPEEVSDRLAPLEFDPAPREVRRAMLVRVNLTAGGGLFGRRVRPYRR